MSRRGGRTVLALQVGSALALAVTGYLHYDLAGGYAGVGSAITQEQLFLAQAVACAAVALAVLLRPSKATFGAVALVGAGSLVAVLLSRYASLPSVGPFPEMTEPVWFPRKTWSAWADLAALLLGLAGLGYRVRLVRR